MESTPPEDFKNALTADEVSVLQYIAKRDEYADYFFKTTSDLKWFWPLKAEGYFDAKEAPGPLRTKEEGYYTTPQWRIIDYLIKVSKQLDKLSLNDRSKIEAELIRIIKETTKRRQSVLASNPKSMECDNFRTWYGFAQILQNVSKSNIDSEIVQGFDVWMRSSFDTVLPGVELGKKMLPLFLNHEDRALAEEISRALLGYQVIVPPPKHTAFEYERKIVSRLDKYWIADIFLKRGNAVNLGKICSPDFVLEIAASLRKMLSVRRAHRFDFCNHAGKEFSFVLFLEDIDTYSRYMLAERQPLSVPDENIFKHDELKPVIDSSEPGRFSDASELGSLISSVCGKALEDGYAPETKDIARFYNQLAQDHSSIWLESLYDAFESGYEDSIAVYVYVLRDLLMGISESRPEDAEAVLKKIWREGFRYPIFKRLVLYCVGRFYAKFAHIFWNQAFASLEFDILDEHELKSEIHQLFLSNAENIPKKELQLLEDRIEAGPQEEREKPLTNIQLAYWKEGWYSAFVTIDKYRQKYEALKAITKSDVKIPHRMEGWIGPGNSPISKEELLSKRNQELAADILAFIEQRRDFSSRVTSEGLAETLVVAIKERPQKFVEDLEPFLKLPYRFVYSILDGISEGYKANTEGHISWEKVFSFIQAYIGRETFWNDSMRSGDSDTRRAGHEWVVGKIAELIRGVTGTDETAIGQEYNSVMTQILRHIIEHLKVENEKEPKDPIIHFLNSPEGKTIEAVLNLSLRSARLKQKNGDSPLWSPELKKMYCELLDSKVHDAYVVLGRYLPNFYFLDDAWAKKKIADLPDFPEEEWEQFFVGYLSSHHVYNNLYEDMRPSYQKAIGRNFSESRAKESLAQHIAIGYLRGLDNLEEGSLLARFLEIEPPEVLERLLGFIWMQRIREDETDLTLTKDERERKEQWLNGISPRIINLWRYIYQNYQQNSKWGPGYRVANAELSKWAVFLKQIDEENFDWLLYAASCLSETVDASFFIEYMTKLKDVGSSAANARYMAAFWEKMLENFTPDYKIENVQDVLEFIKDNNSDLWEKLSERYIIKKRADIVESLM